MYIMKRTDIIFISEGKEVNGDIDDIKLNQVLDLVDKRLLDYRVILNNTFYNVDKEQWEKIEKLYNTIINKDIIKTKSYRINTVDNKECYIDEDDYCIIIRELDLDNYNGEELNYRYFIEARGKEILDTGKFEISKEIFNTIESL